MPTQEEHNKCGEYIPDNKDLNNNLQVVQGKKIVINKSYTPKRQLFYTFFNISDKMEYHDNLFLTDSTNPWARIYPEDCQMVFLRREEEKASSTIEAYKKELSKKNNDGTGTRNREMHSAIQKPTG